MGNPETKMTSIPALVLAAIALTAATGLEVQASAPGAKAKPAAQCFRGGRVVNWTVADDQVIHVRLQTAAVYRVTLVGACPGLGTNRTLAFDGGFNDQVCDGRPATVINLAAAAPLRCAIKSVRRLPPEEAAALPDAERP